MRITNHDDTSSDTDAEELWGNASEEKNFNLLPPSSGPCRQLYRALSHTESVSRDSLDTPVVVPLCFNIGAEARRCKNDNHAKESSQLWSHCVENIPPRTPYRITNVAKERDIQTHSSHSAGRLMQHAIYKDWESRHRSRSLGVRRQLYRRNHTVGISATRASLSPAVEKEERKQADHLENKRQYRSRNLYKSAPQPRYRLKQAMGDTVSSAASSPSIALGRRLRPILYKGDFQTRPQSLNMLRHCSRHLYKAKNNIGDTLVGMPSSSSSTVTILMHPAGDGNENGECRSQSLGLRSASKGFYRIGQAMGDRTSISGCSDSSDVAESELQFAKDVSLLSSTSTMRSSRQSELSIRPSRRPYRDNVNDSPEVMTRTLSTDKDAKKLCVTVCRDGGVIRIPRCLEPWSRFFHQAYRERNDSFVVGVTLSPDAAAKQLCPASRHAQLQRRRPPTTQDGSQRQPPDVGSLSLSEWLRASALRWPGNARLSPAERARRRNEHRQRGRDRSTPAYQVEARAASVLIDGNYLTRSITWSHCGTDTPRDCFVLLERFESRDLQH